MIEVKDLKKDFGGIKALEGISFRVDRGEILGLLGPNGAGKTTTMKIITSFWQASSGSVTVDNLNVAQNSLEAKRRMGYLPENLALYEDMLVSEYLSFIAQIRGVRKSEMREKLKNISKVCGLEAVWNRPIDELSKGYKQRVGLAQAIVHDPDVLILDEPTTGLDPNQIVEIRELIKKIGKEKTVIFSTHILSEASSTCDRIVIINNGKVVGEGRPSDLSRRLGDKQVLYIKIKGFQEEALKKIESLDNVESVAVKDQEGDRIFGYEVVGKTGFDIREHLSRVIGNGGLCIMEYYEKKTGLEDTFRELTK